VLYLRLALVAGGLAVALLAAEFALRLASPQQLFVPGRDTEGWTENTPVFDTYMRIDAQLGYLPLPDTDLYDARGLCRDREEDGDQPAEGPSVLWLGDSVTARRFLEREVRRQCPVPFRSWCGGVEGYNAEQALGYYRRVLRPLRPGQVVFTLHHNDWWNTPIVFYDDQRRVHCRTLDRDVPWFSPWLFQHSYLFRVLFAWRVRGSAAHDATATGKVEAALRGLRDLLRADDIPLLVLVLPPMTPEAQWTDAERARHRDALALLARLDIRHVDLLPGLRRALAEGVDPRQIPGDWMHPSAAVARHLAATVVAAGCCPGR
jgi:hypothetical protein